MYQQFNTLFIIGFILLLSGCSSSPTYVNGDQSYSETEKSQQFNAVHFKLEQQFIDSPPQCIAVLPFISTIEQSNNKILTLDDEKLEQLRWILYSHLAPYAYQDVELKTVDEALVKLNHDKTQHAAIGRSLHCDALLTGKVTEYQSNFLGFYSQTSVGVELTLIRAKNSAVLWQGNHIAKTHAGSVPITPVDIAVGLYSATENMSDEQVVRIKDELFRRLLSTWEPSDNQTIQTNALAQTSTEDESFHVIAYKLNLRQGPGRKFKATDVLDQNEKLALLDTQHSPWVQVQVADGQLGYVHKKYIELSSF